MAIARIRGETDHGRIEDCYITNIPNENTEHFQELISQIISSEQAKSIYKKTVTMQADSTPPSEARKVTCEKYLEQYIRGAGNKIGDLTTERTAAESALASLQA